MQDKVSTAAAFSWRKAVMTSVRSSWQLRDASGLLGVTRPAISAAGEHARGDRAEPRGRVREGGRALEPFGRGLEILFLYGARHPRLDAAAA